MACFRVEFVCIVTVQVTDQVWAYTLYVHLPRFSADDLKKSFAKYGVEVAPLARRPYLHINNGTDQVAVETWNERSLAQFGLNS
jgi:hypothetical protein